MNYPRKEIPKEIIIAESIGYKLARYEKESWLDAAMRRGKGKKLCEELKRSYDKYILLGYLEQRAAWFACYDWDVLEKL